jgi:hypothetical protein
MIPLDKSDLPSDDGSVAAFEYCPECGQPLNLALAAPASRPAVYWRPLFLVVVGCFFAVTSGIGAWHAQQANRFTTVCPGTMVGIGCGSDPYNAAPQLSSQFLPAGGTEALRFVDRDVDSDLRFMAVGLSGLAVGIGGALLRSRRARRHRADTGLLFAAEGLLTVFYGELILLGTYLLVVKTPDATPLTLSSVGDDLLRALNLAFGLFGISG